MGRPRKQQNLVEMSLEPHKDKNATPETKWRVSEVAKKISDGWTKTQTIEWIQEQWDLSEDWSAKYWKLALDYLSVDLGNTEYVQEMKNKVVSIMEALLRKEIDERQYKAANQTLEMLNKVSGAYSGIKLDAKIDGDIKFDFGELE